MGENLAQRQAEMRQRYQYKKPRRTHCVVCSAELATTKGNPQYCSPQCARKVKQHTYHKRHKEEINIRRRNRYVGYRARAAAKRCAVCAGEFLPLCRNQKYCSEKCKRAAYEASPARKAYRRSSSRKEVQKERKFRAREYRLRYLHSHPCVDCGETDLDVLDFDHRNPGDKKRRVGRINTLRALVAEIEKCDVRCANCHRRRHAKGRVYSPLGTYLGNVTLGDNVGSAQ